MEMQQLTSSEAPKVQVRVNADLFLTGWDKEEIQLQSDDRLASMKEGDAIQITALDDCFLSVPRGAQVVVEKANGNADIREISGPVEVLRVGGDCFMRNVGPARIEKIGGDLRLENIESAFVAAVGGDLTGKRLGDLNADGVGGEVDLAELSGALKARAGGDITVQLSAISGQPVNLAAGGDVEVFLPLEASADLSIHSGARDIVLNIGGRRLHFDQHSLSHVLGQGGVAFTISAGGEVELNDAASGESPVKVDFAKYDDRWERQMRHASERVQRRMRKMDDLSEQINKRAEESVRRAQARIDAAMRRRDSVSFEIPPIPPLPPMPSISTAPFEGRSAEAQPEKPAGKVSEEEHMLILRMLQEKKITVEEAEQLLEALENQTQSE